MIAFVFYLFAAALLLSCLLATITQRPVHGALYLVTGFVCASVLWLLQEADFLGLALIFVYVGAVMTLFLFVVMMLNVNDWPCQIRVGARFFTLIAVLLLSAASAVYYVWAHPEAHLAWFVHHAASQGPQTLALGRVLYTDYLLPFQLAALILLVAMVAAIVLVHSSKRQGKRQVASEQMAASKQQRLRLVSDGGAE